MRKLFPLCFPVRIIQAIYWKKPGFYVTIIIRTGNFHPGRVAEFVKALSEEERFIIMEIREYKTYKETDILNLYASVGWTSYTRSPEVLRKGFENSLLTLAAYEGERLIGIIRAVGDGHTIVFIQDILVLPEYQQKGIGSALLQKILERYSMVRQIELVTDNDSKTISFYRSIGFREMLETGCVGFIKT